MQTQTPEQIAQLINQYPFIVELIVKRNEYSVRRCSPNTSISPVCLNNKEKYCSFTQDPVNHKGRRDLLRTYTNIGRLL